MQPAFSVIFLTVLIGAGQGLFLALYACELVGFGATAGDRTLLAGGAAIALVFSALGLLASFFHLGHPERAWRAAAMWRTSWLSREVIALPLFMAGLFAWGLGHALGAPGTRWLGALAAVLCLALYICTAMVYASVRFLQEWASPLTLVNYLLIGCASGSLLATALASFAAPSLVEPLALAALLLTLAALIGRAAALLRNASLKPRSTLQTAIGIKHPGIVQRAQGFMGGSFNTREFFHGRSAGVLRAVKWFFLAAGFVLPAAMLLALPPSGPALLAAVAVQLTGLLAERWFFFAQANHPQNLYYQAILVMGRQHLPAPARLFGLLVLLCLAAPAHAAGADTAGMPWWFWPMALFFACFLMGIVAVPAGIGGGTLFVPIVGGFFPFHLDFVRGAGLLVALASALAAAPMLLRSGLASLRLALPLALLASASSIGGALLGLALPVAAVQTALGVTVLSIVALMAVSKKSEFPLVTTPDRLSSALALNGVFVDGASGRRVDWQVHHTPAGLAVFLGIGVLAGMFGIGAGWANVPALNLLMGAPLKVSAGTSGLVLSLVDSSAAWVYVNKGAVLPMIAVPSVVGMMLGAKIGARLLNVLKGVVIRRMVITVLLFAGLRALLKGTGVWA